MRFSERIKKWFLLYSHEQQHQKYSSFHCPNIGVEVTGDYRGKLTATLSLLCLVTKNDHRSF